MNREEDDLFLSEGGWPKIVEDTITTEMFKEAAKIRWWYINERGESVWSNDYNQTDNDRRFYSQMKTHFPDGSFLSTIHLSLDHQYDSSGPPILWESLWFGRPEDKEYMERYTSLTEAVYGHNRLVNERFEEEFNNGTFRRPDAYYVQDVLDQLSSETTRPRYVPEVPEGDGDSTPGCNLREENTRDGPITGLLTAPSRRYRLRTNPR